MAQHDLRAREYLAALRIKAIESARTGEIFDKALVDEALGGGMPTAAFADRNQLGPRRERDRVGMNERVVKHDIGAPQYPGCANCQEIGRAGARAD